MDMDHLGSKFGIENLIKAPYQIFTVSSLTISTYQNKWKWKYVNGIVLMNHLSTILFTDSIDIRHGNEGIGFVIWPNVPYYHIY